MFSKQQLSIVPHPLTCATSIYADPWGLTVDNRFTPLEPDTSEWNKFLSGLSLQFLFSEPQVSSFFSLMVSAIPDL